MCVNSFKVFLLEIRDWEVQILKYVSDQQLSTNASLWLFLPSKTTEMYETFIFRYNAILNGSQSDACRGLIVRRAITQHHQMFCSSWTFPVLSVCNSFRPAALVSALQMQTFTFHHPWLQVEMACMKLQNGWAPWTVSVILPWLNFESNSVNKAREGERPISPNH